MRIVVLLLLVSGLGLQAQDSKTPYQIRSLQKEKIHNIQLQTSGGSLKVMAVDPSEARLEVYIQGNDEGSTVSKAAIEERLRELYDLVIEVQGHQLTALAKLKPGVKNTNWKRSLSISFAAFVPKEVSTELSTSGGSIQLNGISGNQDFVTSGGSLQLNDVHGKIKGRTSGGSIRVENSSESIDLVTSGGGITAKNCTGTIRLHTSAGTLHLNDLNGNINAVTSGGSINGETITGALHATTSGGSIRLNKLSCDLETATSGGSIQVAFLKIGNYVKVRNSGGSITLQLPKDKGMDLDVAANNLQTKELVNFSGKSNSGGLDGKMNGGGVPVKVRSSGGQVSLLFE
ncbi:DUF4097 family beta strand repeat-containing protein [Flavihumibacter sp. CACIAM 22H1]|uniref:DUF4097 family beta strand repeat-containing protein n=1 Tax=Flavihumibacter sp. CACIAM 22H1 TaxID=1812911 RepID=UPI0007A84F02|nr:DUF4097 family beta strand repeat-containing protein [Flavihumibacter sp. CACIAM 22H1]KYP15349.1 MAG: hypothetical protein A1D16_15735 [Flavihumibacter sp. CACIAM 22H1]